MNLALKGHKSRGTDVIKLLEMLGGKNIYNLTGTKEIWYILSNNTIEHSSYLFEEKGFTIEEFLEKFPYKVGDKVIYENKMRTITKMVWEEQTNTVAYKLDDKMYCNVLDELQPYKEKTLEATEEFYNKYCANCGSQRCTRDGEWLEACEHYKKEQDTTEKKYNIEDYLNFWDYIKTWKETGDGLEFVVNDGFELKIDNGKFFLAKKQHQLPQTFEECCEVLNIHPKPYLTYTWNMTEDDICSVLTQYHEDLAYELDDLRMLLICRNAYWKYADDWKPDWKNGDQLKCVIAITKGELEFNKYYFEQKILAFPTEEMLSEFYKNFKDLITRCMQFL